MRSPPPPHPRLRARGTRPDRARATDTPTRALVFAPSADIARWAESELARDGMTIQVARSMTHVIAALTEDPSACPQFLVIDLDAASAADLIRLHTIREQGWFGALIALGHVPPELRTSLAIASAVTPPLSRDQLRDAIAALRAPVETLRVPVIRDLV
jgi:hypothetical protein